LIVGDRSAVLIHPSLPSPTGFLGRWLKPKFYGAAHSVERPKILREVLVMRLDGSYPVQDMGVDDVSLLNVIILRENDPLGWDVGFFCSNHDILNG
jgi:hypothetical protein